MEKNIIMLIITIVWAAAVVFLSIRAYKKGTGKDKIKAVATAAGMLGTFLGIVAGLFFFDAADIDGSIEDLLGGLKAAFITSIAGLSVSMIITMLQKFDESSASGESGGDAARDVQEEILQEIRLMNTNTVSGLTMLHNSISGDGETSLNTSIAKLRIDNSDNLKALKSSFESFAEKMANQNIDALTEAIEKVMGEFNTTINEKLGKTFDDFRASVDNLNGWQQQYLTQIEAQTKNMEEMRNATNTMSQDLQEMQKSYSKIGETNEQFKEMVGALNQKIQEMVGFITSLSKFADDLDGKSDVISREIKNIATSSFELINIELKKTTQVLTDNALDIQKEMAGIGHEVSESTKLATEEMQQKMLETLGVFGNHIASISERLTQDWKSIQESLNIRN